MREKINNINKKILQILLVQINTKVEAEVEEEEEISEAEITKVEKTSRLVPNVLILFLILSRF